MAEIGSRSSEPQVKNDVPNPILAEFWVRATHEIDADLADLRAAGPVFLAEPQPPAGSPMSQGPGAWVITDPQHILDMSRNPSVFSSAAGITVTDSPPELREFFGSMIAMDDPRHARLRRLVSKGFTPRMLARLEDSVQAQASEIVDDIIERGECDFVVDVAAVLPLKIVCDLMGVPNSELGFVFDRTNVILGVSDPEYRPAGTEILSALVTAGSELAQLMYSVAESKKGGDASDLTSVLVNAEVEDDKLSHDDLASFFILLVVAGNETTRNAISWGLHYLTVNPDQKAIWFDDFERVAPSAVEEIVRLASPVSYMRRTARCDTNVGGQPIAEGDKLCMFYIAANRDEDLFPDPLRFDVRRSPNPHSGFGGPGPHYCLGAHLARREITVMFRELSRRMPDIHSDGVPEPLRSSFIHGVKHLPAAFTSGRQSTS